MAANESRLCHTPPSHDMPIVHRGGACRACPSTWPRGCTAMHSKCQTVVDLVALFGTIQHHVPAGWVACRRRTRWWHSCESTAENVSAKSLSHNPPTRMPLQNATLDFQRSVTRVLERQKKGFPARSGVHPPLRMPSRPLHPRSACREAGLFVTTMCILSDFASMTVVR